jgi:16S rRNA (adenine1518-N6/adenine1519-N6)-dimethyltransferase
MEEIFDVVDEHDQVIGQAPRSIVHRDRLLHRATHVLVFNSAGHVLMQLRSATKDEYPLCYTSSASGHVGAGETYDATAVRELQEELGIAGKPEFLTILPASAETAFEFTAVYRIESDHPPKPDPAEIEAIEWTSWSDLTRRLQDERERFSPPFRAIIEWYTRHRLAK